MYVQFNSRFQINWKGAHIFASGPSECDRFESNSNQYVECSLSQRAWLFLTVPYLLQVNPNHG